VAAQRARRGTAHRRRLDEVGQLHRAPQVPCEAEIRRGDGHGEAELAQLRGGMCVQSPPAGCGAGGDEQDVDGGSRHAPKMLLLCAWRLR
jgi:hypothetical protein